MTKQILYFRYTFTPIDENSQRDVLCVYDDGTEEYFLDRRVDEQQIHREYKTWLEEGNRTRPPEDE